MVCPYAPRGPARATPPRPTPRTKRQACHSAARNRPRPKTPSSAPTCTKELCAADHLNPIPYLCLSETLESVPSAVPNDAAPTPVSGWLTM